MVREPLRSRVPAVRVALVDERSKFCGAPCPLALNAEEFAEDWVDAAFGPLALFLLTLLLGARKCCKTPFTDLPLPVLPVVLCPADCVVGRFVGLCILCPAGCVIGAPLAGVTGTCCSGEVTMNDGTVEVKANGSPCAKHAVGDVAARESDSARKI